MALTHSSVPKIRAFIEPHKEVIEKAKQGDQNAMHRLYVLYSKALLNTAFRILNNREDAEDVLQDAFIKIFSRLDQFRYQSTFGAWVKRIVVNKSIDELKKKQRIIFQEENGEHLYENPPSLKLEQQNDLQNKLDQLYKAMHDLPNGYRTVFSLYMLEGYDHNEISEIMNITVSTSISQLSRAKKKLKSLTIKAPNHGRI
jgi:RNA polymerase sigma-70 factor (ECF subfamily)